VIIQMAGLPGTGKTTIADELARLIPATVISKDHIRHSLFSGHQIAYDREQDDFCADVAFGAAAQLLRLDPAAVIILDGRTCSRAYQISSVRSFARQMCQDLRIIECCCTEETACQRLADDTSLGRHPAANRDPGLYRTLQARADPIPPPKLIVPTDEALPASIARCMYYLTRVPSRPIPSRQPGPGSRVRSGKAGTRPRPTSDEWKEAPDADQL
jgi:predicted kinase